MGEYHTDRGIGVTGPYTETLYMRILENLSFPRSSYVGSGKLVSSKLSANEHKHPWARTRTDRTNT